MQTCVLGELVAHVALRRIALYYREVLVIGFHAAYVSTRQHTSAYVRAYGIERYW
jgi:hypothetical protein